MEAKTKEEMKELLTAFIDEDCKTPPLCTAATEGNVGLVVALLRKFGADKNFKDNVGETPLMKAADKGHLPVVEALLDAGADVTITNDLSRSVLHLAALQGYDGIVNVLLKAGAAKDVRDCNLCTPLHHAADEGHVPVVNALIDWGADKNALDWENISPLSLAICSWHTPVVNALLDKGADVNADVGYLPLFAAVAYENMPIVLELLDRGAVTERGYDSALIHAVRQGYRSVGHQPVAMVECLLAAGCDPNHRDAYQRTALHEAASNNCVEHVSLMLQWGADETALDRDGKTPADLIHKSRPQHGAVRHLLARAPADRAWRRRGWLVMVCSRTPKSGGSSGSSNDGGATVGRSVKQRCGDSGGKESFDLFAAVAQLRQMEEGVFRNVVGFL